MAERPETAGVDDGWAVHRRQQRHAILVGTTPAQRLAWLEEAIEFAARAGALPRRERKSAD